MKLWFKYYPHDNHWSIITWEGALRSTHTIRKRGLDDKYLVRFRYGKIIYIAESLQEAKEFVHAHIKKNRYKLDKPIVQKCSPYKYKFVLESLK